LIVFILDAALDERHCHHEVIHDLTLAHRT
jgi:hypothetical protein